MTSHSLNGCAASLMSAVVRCGLYPGQRAFANTLPCVPDSLLHYLRGKLSFNTVIDDACLSKLPNFCKRVTRRLSVKAIASYQTARRDPAERRHVAGDKAVFKQGTIQFYVTCHPGLEEVTAKELAAPNIAAFNIQPGKAGVHFRCASPYFLFQLGFVAYGMTQGHSKGQHCMSDCSGMLMPALRLMTKPLHDCNSDSSLMAAMVCMKSST